jgi:hypothetical protein
MIIVFSHRISAAKVQSIIFHIICHGDRVPARFGPVGGLSQPRRDTADPKTLIIDYFLMIIVQGHHRQPPPRRRITNNQSSFINNHSKATPCDGANSKGSIVPLWESESRVFSKKCRRPRKRSQKSIFLDIRGINQYNTGRISPSSEAAK